MYVCMYVCIYSILGDIIVEFRKYGVFLIVYTVVV